MPEDKKKLLGLLGLTLCVYALKTEKRRKRRFKVRPINRTRRSAGGFEYFKKIKNMDDQQFFKYTRLTQTAFQKLINLIKPKFRIQKRSDGILLEERLVITLQYLSQGVSMQSLAWTFQIGHTTVHKIIKETCEILWDVLQPIYLKTPDTMEEWEDICKGFYDRWNLPNCLGALDGKHINIQAPAKSGSIYYNYKNRFSIVLLAACDSKYRFTLVDIGAYGSQSDGGIFKNSVFGQNLESGELNIPQRKKLPNSHIDLPCFFAADEAFPLKSHIMRPYPGKNLTSTERIFNYRLSRARQVIENTFGIMSARWRILRNDINAIVNNVDKIIKAIVCLHNYCQTEIINDYCPNQFVDGDNLENGGWREEQARLPSVGRVAANVAKRQLYENRNMLATYLVNEGQVSWQYEIINRNLFLVQN